MTEEVTLNQKKQHRLVIINQFSSNFERIVVNFKLFLGNQVNRETLIGFGYEILKVKLIVVLWEGSPMMGLTKRYVVNSNRLQVSL